MGGNYQRLIIEIARDSWLFDAPYVESPYAMYMPAMFAEMAWKKRQREGRPTVSERGLKIAGQGNAMNIRKWYLMSATGRKYK